MRTALVASLFLTAGLVAQSDGAPPPNLGGSNPATPPGTFTAYGTGCAGSGGGATGPAHPKAYRTQWGESANYFPHGRANMRYQQIHDASDIGTALVVRGLAYRLDERYGGPAGNMDLEYLMGYSANSAATMSTSFAANVKTGTTMTQVFKGKLNFPQHSGGNTNLNNFAVQVLFTRPWVYSPAQGNLIWEAVNTSPSNVVHYFDWARSSGIPVRRIWAFSTTAATGNRDATEAGLVTSLLNTTGRAVPVLSNTGLPNIAKSFNIDLSRARANTVAVLIIGARRLAIDLTSAGAPGCTLLTTIDIILGVPVGAGGAATVPFTFPNDRSLVGVVFDNQFAVVDGVNALQLVFSNGGEAKIGDA